MFPKKIQMKKMKITVRNLSWFKSVCWMDSNDTENFLRSAYAQNPNNEFITKIMHRNYNIEYCNILW